MPLTAIAINAAQATQGGASKEPRVAMHSGKSSPSPAAGTPATPGNRQAAQAAQTSELESYIWKPPDDVRRERRLSPHELAGFQHQVAEEWLGRHNALVPTRAGSLRRRKLELGCAVLDPMLRGGLPTDSLTEIAGEASCGKTQICMQLLLQAQLPLALGGLCGSAVYISTEHELPQERLEQIAHTRPRFSAHFSTTNPLENLFVEHADTADTLAFVIRKLPELVEQKRTTDRPIRLVVIDSIAAVFRCDEERSNARARVPELLALASRLKRLAASNGLAVVIVNQITDVMTGDERQGSFGGGGGWCGGGSQHQGAGWQMPTAAGQVSGFLERPPSSGLSSIAVSTQSVARAVRV